MYTEDTNRQQNIPGGPGGFQPFFPPGQTPGFPPGRPPVFQPSPTQPTPRPPGFQFPFGQFFGGGQIGAPTSPPPAFTPAKPQFTIQAVDPGAIRGCLYRFTFIWTRGGGSFWAFPIFVGPQSIAGFRWTGFGWVFFGLDLRFIDYFQCY
ncbi:hypothetical protein [Caldalkalibacillus salinus]|uniref:hypothetical protein n=1 Tax=Caldalkalibacillus salinus TaxID=2803787 RepID=UPI001F1677CE|nr:hypothetical protein [Caldalkalibacillus salinus]